LNNLTNPQLDYSPPKRRRLKPSEVKYLVFEGGGGKGFAYLGGLRALQEKNILKYISPNKSLPPSADGTRHSQLDFRYLRGVGGASAGAITAFLLSIGLTLSELADLMGQKDKFLAFFDGGYNDPNDQTVTRLAPVFGGGPYRSVTDSNSEKQEKGRLQFAETILGLEAKIAQFESSVKLLPSFVGDLIKSFDDLIGKYKSVSPFDKLIPHWKDFAVNFKSDWGLFAGFAARDLFDKLLSDRMPPGADGKPQKNIPFEAHYQHFNVELLVMGTNLLTGKSQVFSHVDTPWVPVADAVRISMGIPFVFKPVVIQKDDPSVAGHPEMRGCWVDGGLLNNTPFREFDDRPGDNPKTLALRLEIDSDLPDIQSVGNFFSSYLKLALGGPGESYITSSHAFQAIVLDTTGLSLLDFASKQSMVKRVGDAAYKSVGAYFTGDPNQPSYTVTVDSP
jgi:predicted acylesterase/phospholipase RssA